MELNCGGYSRGSSSAVGVVGVVGVSGVVLAVGAALGAGGALGFGPVGRAGSDFRCPGGGAFDDDATFSLGLVDARRRAVTYVLRACPVSMGVTVVTTCSAGVVGTLDVSCSAGGATIGAVTRSGVVY